MELVRPRNYPVFEVERTVGCKSSTRPEMGEVLKMLGKDLSQPLPPNWTKVNYKEFFHLG